MSTKWRVFVDETTFCQCCPPLNSVDQIKDYAMCWASLLTGIGIGIGLFVGLLVFILLHRMH